jgi:hypothetical protein
LWHHKLEQCSAPGFGHGLRRHIPIGGSSYFNKSNFNKLKKFDTLLVWLNHTRTDPTRDASLAFNTVFGSAKKYHFIMIWIYDFSIWSNRSDWSELESQWITVHIILKNFWPNRVSKTALRMQISCLSRVDLFRNFKKFHASGSVGSQWTSDRAAIGSIVRTPEFQWKNKQIEDEGVRSFHILSRAVLNCFVNSRIN